MELHTDCRDVVAVDLAEEVVAYLADIGTPPAKRGEAGHGVAHRSARDLDRRPHQRVERLGPLGIDQGHRPLDERLACEKRVVSAGDHVDNGIADADDIDIGLGHALAMIGQCNGRGI